MKPTVKRRVASGIAGLILFVAAISLYWQTTQFSFLTYDDDTYVTNNEYVVKGLTVNGLWWAFSGVHGGNWHPLTSISHMLDCEIYGLNPACHHAANAALHTINTILLFALFFSMTGSLWRSAGIAALFAVHPMHVESVAWISERKDVLSAFFFLLTLLFYDKYAKTRTLCAAKDDGLGKPSSGREHRRILVWSYGLALMCFACGLMSKAMLVTAPFIMLLLDYWPLDRWRHLLGARETWILIREKIPFLVLSLIVSGITIVAQRSAGTVATLTMIPIRSRFENAFVSYARYVEKLFWPENLAVIYPYEFSWPWTIVLGCIALILFLTLSVWLLRFRMPWLFVGWFWFFLMLVPVIGVVQVGEQAMADRYTYLPAVGIFVAVVWTSATLCSRVPLLAKLQWIPHVVVLAVLTLITDRQIQHWKSSISLFQHALAVTRNNQTAHRALGSALLRDGKLQAALNQFQDALKLNPEDPILQNNLGVALSALGRFEESLRHYQAALALSPDDADVHFNLGNFTNPEYQDQWDSPHTSAKNPFKDPVKARYHYARAAELRPRDPSVRINWAILEASQGRQAEAVEHFLAAIDLDPDNASARFNLGEALLASGQIEPAIGRFREAIELSPGNVLWHRKIARTLANAGKVNESLAHFSEVVARSSSDPLGHYELANALAKCGDFEQAIQHLETAIKLRDDFVPSLNDLAWIRSVHPNPKFRNGQQAVLLAEQAAKITSLSEPRVLSTLAAAYAEAGIWDKAIDSTQRAVELANRVKNGDLAEKLEARIPLFKSKRPYRETAWEPGETQ